MHHLLILLFFAALLGAIVTPAAFADNTGFRGLWYDLGQKSQYGSKYSGGLGTYTANHVPMAIYVPAVNRTYLTWGGTSAPDETNLHIMTSYYDHNSGLVARPVMVMDKTPVDDAHDNGSLAIDDDGYLWVFVSGRWTGTEWRFHEVAPALHNYDMGSLYIEDDGTWKVIAPIGGGPQYWGTGGEVELWTSNDQGATWAKQRAVTTNSPRNHSYVRRPRNAHPDFYAYWADGHADEFSESHLWFTNKEGDKLWHLPYDMDKDFAAPTLIDP